MDRAGIVEWSADGWCRGTGEFSSNPNLQAFYFEQHIFGMHPGIATVSRIDQNLEELIPGSHRNGIR